MNARHSVIDPAPDFARPAPDFAREEPPFACGEADRQSAINILGLDRAGLEAFFQELGEARFRAHQVLRWVHQRGLADFETMTDLSKALRQELTERSVVCPPTIQSRQASQDGTIKWLLRLSDGNAVETVFIPESDRGTLCISSQAGCPLDCKFCATGYAGFNRNLTTAEIIGQVYRAHAEVGGRLTNIVFMGMGEPLLNYEAVVRAINLLLDDYAYGLSRRRITVSTVGVVPRIRQLGETTPVNLAISLHGVTNAVRDRIVPLNRKYPLETLLDACRHYPLTKGRRITFEYVMLDGVNDSPQEAKRLVQRLAGIPAKVNLIPFNPFPGAQFRRSPSEAIDHFRQLLLDRGIVAVTRTPRGEDIDAACGQLQGQFQAHGRRGRSSPPGPTA